MKAVGLQETDKATIEPIAQAIVRTTVALQRIQDFRVTLMSRIKSRSMSAATEPLAAARERIKNICEVNVACTYLKKNLPWVSKYLHVLCIPAQRRSTGCLTFQSHAALPEVEERPALLGAPAYIVRLYPFSRCCSTHRRC